MEKNLTKQKNKAMVMIICISIIISTVLSSSTMSFATESVSESPVVINEFEMLKDLNKDLKRGNNKEMFSQLSRANKEIISNFREVYTEQIKELDTYSNEQLVYWGYDSDQIDAIRNFDGSDEMMTRAATKVVVKIGFRNKVYTSAGGTKVKLIADFNCKGITITGFDDMFAVTWSSPLSISSRQGTLEYRGNAYLNPTEVSKTVRSNGIYGCEMVFGTSRGFDNPKPGMAKIYKYLYAGSIILNLKSNTKVKDFQGYAAYGHTSITFGGVSASILPGASISFSVGTSTAGSAYAKL